MNAQPLLIDKDSKIGILMLHGFTSTPRQFKELGEFLASHGFTVYAPLIAGHGTNPQDLMRTTQEEWKLSVKNAYLDFKKGVEKVVLVGNSFGANLAFWLAREFNNEMLGIVSLGAPVFLRWERIIKFRLFTYGRFMMERYYKKPRRLFRTDYTDMKDEVSYPVIPVRSLFEFFKFLEEETRIHLDKVKVPVLIAYASHDRVIHPRSADYLFSHLGSEEKEIFWFPANVHGKITNGCPGLFPKIYQFIEKNTKSAYKKDLDFKNV